MSNVSYSDSLGRRSWLGARLRHSKRIPSDSFQDLHFVSIRTRKGSCCFSSGAKIKCLIKAELAMLLRRSRDAGWLRIWDRSESSEGSQQRRLHNFWGYMAAPNFPDAPKSPCGLTGKLRPKLLKSLDKPSFATAEPTSGIFFVVRDFKGWGYFCVVPYRCTNGEDALCLRSSWKDSPEACMYINNSHGRLWRCHRFLQ